MNFEILIRLSWRPTHQCFSFAIGWCHNCYPLHEDLAKSHREVDKIQNRAIVWRPVVTFCINLTIGYRPAFLAKILQKVSVFLLQVPQKVSWKSQQSQKKKNAATQPPINSKWLIWPSVVCAQHHTHACQWTPPLVRGRTFKQTTLICFVAQLTVYDWTSGVKLMRSIFFDDKQWPKIVPFMLTDWCKTEGNG